MTQSELHAFLKWCAQYKGFPYSQVSYWIDAYARGDGTDQYGARMKKAR